MYSAKKVQKLIDKANKEAEKAAQNVYDKYQKELNLLIKTELQKDDIIYTGMGSASLSRKGKTIYSDNELVDAIQRLQCYHKLDAGFTTEDKIMKGK